MSHFLIAVLVATLSAVALGDIDITVPGYPLVDGPMEHIRQVYRPLVTNRPYAIGHRGCAGEFPEHSSLAYLAGINHGADFIECDMVVTKDLQIICRHEPNLSNTTNADDIFPQKTRTYLIDGANSTGVHAIDLTLKQIRKIRLRERIYTRNQGFNDVYPIVTLEEHMHFVKHAARVVGLYPETKHPTWYDTQLKARGHKTTITDLAMKIFKKHGYDNAIDTPEWAAKPIFLQSFEVKNLQYARSISSIPIIQLMDATTKPLPDNSYPTYGDMMTAQALGDIAKYANGIGPWKETLQTVVPQPDGTYLYNSTGLVERAHAAGLQVHLYTLRNELNQHTLGLDLIEDEYAHYFKTLGVDGGFTDFPGTLVPWMRNETAKNTTFPLIVRPSAKK